MANTSESSSRLDRAPPARYVARCCPRSVVEGVDDVVEAVRFRSICNYAEKAVMSRVQVFNILICKILTFNQHDPMIAFLKLIRIFHFGLEIQK